MPYPHPWSGYILERGILLACALLASALLLSVWADARPFAFPFLRHYVAYTRSSATTVLIASLLGSIFLEDILRKTQP